MNDKYQPENLVGHFAFSGAGHDKGQLYVITMQEGDCVYLCDGSRKPYESPKKKKRKHIQPVGKTVERELLERLIGKEKVRDEDIKFQIKRYLEG